MPALPRGLRNNNPANIRIAPRPQDRWQGVTGGDDAGFAIFDTMANGIRAAAKQLLAYQEGWRKLNTIARIVSVWAPPIENETAKYIGFVCATCELREDDPLELRDFDTLYWLTRAICEYENGRKTFDANVSEETLQAGVKSALA